MDFFSGSIPRAETVAVGWTFLTCSFVLPKIFAPTGVEGLPVLKASKAAAMLETIFEVGGYLPTGYSPHEYANRLVKYAWVKSVELHAAYLATGKKESSPYALAVAALLCATKESLQKGVTPLAQGLLRALKDIGEAAPSTLQATRPELVLQREALGFYTSRADYINEPAPEPDTPHYWDSSGYATITRTTAAAEANAERLVASDLRNRDLVRIFACLMLPFWVSLCMVIYSLIGGRKKAALSYTICLSIVSTVLVIRAMRAASGF